MPRIKAIADRSSVAPAHHHVVDAVQKVFGNVRGPFSMLLHSPALAERLLPLVLFFREQSVVDVLRAKGDPSKLGDEERDIVTYVRQLMRTNRIDQTAFDALKKRHDEQWIVELTAAANYFAFLSGIVNAFEVPAPPDGDKLPA